MNDGVGAALTGRWLVGLDAVGGSALPDRQLIGGKAWSIAHMQSLGMPTPSAFVVTTEACLAYQRSGAMPDGLEAELQAGMCWLERRSGRRFGHDEKPLLVAVRSGAATSMPGMMDTLLNLGISEANLPALAAESGDGAFARDTYRRFFQLYVEVVLGTDCPDLECGQDLGEWRAQIERNAGQALPDDPMQQLHAAVRAVFDSWNSRRARRYRKHHGIPETLGTAVTVQRMVFGNLDEQSGTGVLFSRNPLDGAPVPYGEYLCRAQGEDVVSGRHTPGSLDDLHAQSSQLHAQLLAAAGRLEASNREVQDIEFTVERGKLFLLQSRTAKRAPAAAVRIVVDMQREGVIDIDEALSKVTPAQVRSLLSPRLTAQAAKSTLVATGNGVSPGVGIGVVVTNADEAERRAKRGEAVVLATTTTCPDDVHGMIAARAVVTEFGGATSHAAVVGRSLGLPCVVGCGAGAVTALSGDTVTVDGGAGGIYSGILEIDHPDEREDEWLRQLLEWVAERSPLRVLRADEAPEGNILDLDALEAATEPDRLVGLLQGVEPLAAAPLPVTKASRRRSRQSCVSSLQNPLCPRCWLPCRCRPGGPQVSTNEHHDRIAMERRTFQDINTLIELFENSDWRELSIEVEDFSLHLSRDEGVAGPGQGASLPDLEQPRGTAAEDRQEAQAPESAAELQDDEALEGLTVVRAPNLGLFYRSPEPGAPPYVQIGEEVGEDTEVCVIEVMKLFTPVVAGVNGVVRRICVEDGALVEFDQPLFYVEPRS